MKLSCVKNIFCQLENFGPNQNRRRLCCCEYVSNVFGWGETLGTFDGFADVALFRTISVPEVPSQKYKLNFANCHFQKKVNLAIDLLPLGVYAPGS